MTTDTERELVTIARGHLGDPGPDNSCMSNGLERWAREAGIPTLGTDSVTEAERLARQGHNGWAYHAGTSGAHPGVFLDWDPSALASTDDRHVSLLTEVDEYGRFRSIGSGGPSGEVAYQPRGGGYNPPALFRGYFEAPDRKATPAPAPKPASKPKTGTVSTSSGKTYTVRKGDTLTELAREHHTSIARLLKLNPREHNGHSADFAIRDADHIEVGQRIRLP